MKPELAGKFSSYVLPGYRDQKGRRILYIGKATARAFDEPNAAKNAFDGHGPFWDFARRISKAAAPDCEDLSNLAWSNLFKQGVVIGNPTGTIAEEQRALAVAELRREIVELQPTLLVLANAGYYEEIIKEAFEIKDGEGDPPKLIRTTVPGEEKNDLWSRAAYRSIPPLVWMYHPQIKRAQYLDAALALIRQTAHW